MSTPEWICHDVQLRSKQREAIRGPKAKQVSVGNPVINYYNAVLEADIPCYPKTALLVLVKNMDYNTRQTYIGQKKIAKQMGASYNTARRALDALEKEHKLIKLVGMHLIHPGSADGTQIFEVLIEPLPSEGTSTLLGDNPAPPQVTSTLIGRQSIQRGVVSPDSRGVSEISNAIDKPHTYTHTHSDALDSKQEDYTEIDQNQTPRFTDEEGAILVKIFEFLTDKPSEDGYASLMKYTGPSTSERLALLMYYAFRISKYWKIPSNWHSVDIENFIGASRKLDGEIRKWRQHEGLVKKFSTLQAALDYLIPPAAPESDEDAAAIICKAFEIEDDDEHMTVSKAFEMEED
jgi:hypothetical protein